MNLLASLLTISFGVLLSDLMIPGPSFATNALPRVFILNRVGLTIAKQRTQQNDESLKPQWQSLGAMPSALS